MSGVWNASGSGSLSGTADVYSNGSLFNAQTISGTYQIDATGRGNGTVVSSGIGLGVNATFYVVSPNDLLIMATEPSLVSGRAHKQ